MAMALRLYPLEYLLFKLQGKCVESRNEAGSKIDIYRMREKPFASVLMAKDFISRDEFMYNDIGCEYHIEIDNNAHCCLSKVNDLR